MSYYELLDPGFVTEKHESGSLLSKWEHRNARTSCLALGYLKSESIIGFGTLGGLCKRVLLLLNVYHKYIYIFIYLYVCSCRVKHVTMLLAESERECARMLQLSELLKSELRRVRGATANAHNTEYMKNVTFKVYTRLRYGLVV